MSIDLAKSINDLMLRGADAFVSVLLVLLFTLRSIHGPLLVLATAAIAIAGTALSLYLLHLPANMLTLAGLAMGIGVLVQKRLHRRGTLRRAPTPRTHVPRRVWKSARGLRVDAHHRRRALPFPLPSGECAGGVCALCDRVCDRAGWSVGTA